MLGYKDDEMTARWTQYGIFSPIMRLHSSCSEFNGKEPWRFKKETEVVMEEALRERHRMMPYLYTMNYRSYQEDLPLVEPMYYEYPEAPEAYAVKNQYFFGDQLMVAAVTTPRVKGLNVAKTAVWLPDGVWYDIYTGLRYEGGRMVDMYRTLDSIPVLAKAGGILVMTDEIRGTEAEKNPESLNIRVFPGADGSFRLYEDDNETCAYENGACVFTEMDYKEKDQGIRKEDIVRIVTTGYGRAYIDSGDDSITEITCHAKGAHYLNPNVRTVIDIGGQDIKAISIDENGAVKNFLMNDKCAAGTGRFLEMMARTLGLSLEEMSTRGLEWKENVVISSMCTVFAESEVVSLVAQNKDVADIIHGLNVSVASKVGALAARLGKKNPGEYMMTGGVARNKGIIQALEEKLGAKLYICDEAQLCGALGAALFAYEKCNAAR